MPRAKKPTIVKTNAVPNQGEELRIEDERAMTTDEFKARAEYGDITFDKPKHTMGLAPVPDAPNLPHVTICIITFRRFKEIQQTIDALLMYLQYPLSKLHWLIADDSSGDEYIANIKRIARYKDLDLQFSVTPTNGGWARNVNLALSKVETDLYFFIEDDYELRKPLDLRVGVALLETKPHIGMLRYRGTAGGHFVTHQMEADIAAYLPDYQDGVGLPGKLTYCLIDSGSHDLYIYSHGASLRRKSFDRFYGEYPEGLKLGATEERYAHNVKDLMKTPNAPAIAILPEWVAMWFDHTGQSRQHTEYDKGL